MLSQAMIDKLKKLAQSECFYDNQQENCCVEDWAGGNVDDAFGIGQHAGEVTLAREIVADLIAERMKG